jgi:hypothetical protein
MSENMHGIDIWEKHYVAFKWIEKEMRARVRIGYRYGLL